MQRLVGECSAGHREPQVHLVQQRLNEIWKVETDLLKRCPFYLKVREERQLQEVYPTEETSVVYDGLGHGVLCIADGHPVWKSYILQNYLNEVEILAEIGSWQARKWLNMDIGGNGPRPEDKFMAERFFLGNIEVYGFLKSAYGYL